MGTRTLPGGVGGRHVRSLPPLEFFSQQGRLHRGSLCLRGRSCARGRGDRGIASATWSLGE